MEQSQGGMGEHHIMFIRRLDALRIHHASTRRRQITNTALPRPMDVIREGEERVARTTNTVQLRCPLCPLLRSEGRRHGLEVTFPLCLLPTIELLTTYEKIDGVGFLCSLDAFLEGERKDAGVMAKPPVVGFRTSEACAVNSRLLTCAEADKRSAEGVCHTVRLRVFKSEGSNYEVRQGNRRDLKHKT